MTPTIPKPSPNGDLVARGIYYHESGAIEPIVFKREADARIAELLLDLQQAQEREMTAVEFAHNLMAERDDARAALAKAEALLKEGCNLLAHETEVLRISVTVDGELSANPDDEQNVAALREIEDWIKRAGAALTPAQTEGGDHG